MSENWPDFPGDHHEPADSWPDHHDPSAVPPDDAHGGHDEGLWDVHPSPEHEDADRPYWTPDEPGGHTADAGEPDDHPALSDAGTAETAGHEAAEPVTHAVALVGADPDAYADPLPDTEFPPPVDVGPLPEPMDGFPWIDASGLGDAGAVGPHLDPVDPHDLAAYAGVDLPPDGDPWAVLAASPDPATAALARWWSDQSPAT